MSTQLSFSKIENRIRHDFRNKINSATTTGEVRQYYAQLIEQLFSEASNGAIILEDDAVALNPGDQSSMFIISDTVKNNNDFDSLWHNSDIGHIVSRFAESAIHRMIHLEKHPEKTEAKIRM